MKTIAECYLWAMENNVVLSMHTVETSGFGKAMRLHAYKISAEHRYNKEKFISFIDLGSSLIRDELLSLELCRMCEQAKRDLFPVEIDTTAAEIRAFSDAKSSTQTDTRSMRERITEARHVFQRDNGQYPTRIRVQPSVYDALLTETQQAYPNVIELTTLYGAALTIDSSLETPWVLE